MGRALDSRGILGAVAWRWIVRRATGLVSVSCWRVWSVVIVMRSVSCVGSGGAAVRLSQTALDGQLHQLIIAQITVERIILIGRVSCGAGVRDAGCRHDGMGGFTSLKQRNKKFLKPAETLLQLQSLIKKCYKM